MNALYILAKFFDVPVYQLSAFLIGITECEVLGVLRLFKWYTVHAEANYPVQVTEITDQTAQGHRFFKPGHGIYSVESWLATRHHYRLAYPGMVCIRGRNESTGHNIILPLECLRVDWERMCQEDIYRTDSSLEWRYP